MKRSSLSRRWNARAAAAASLTASAALALALGCASTGTAKPQASAPPAATDVAAKAPPASAAGPQAAQAQPGPKAPLEVLGGETFSFGAIWPGEVLKHSFTLKNTGGTELKILRVQPG